MQTGRRRVESAVRGDGPAANACASADSSVVRATSPRQLSSSRTDAGRLGRLIRSLSWWHDDHPAAPAAIIRPACHVTNDGRASVSQPPTAATLSFSRPTVAVRHLAADSLPLAGALPPPRYDRRRHMRSRPGVTLDDGTHPDLPIAVADRIELSEDAQQVDVAFDRGFDPDILMPQAAATPACGSIDGQRPDVSLRAISGWSARPLRPTGGAASTPGMPTPWDRPRSRTAAEVGAVATPTRGPVRIALSGAGEPACSRIALSGRHRSAPLSEPSRPSTVASPAGPRARNRSARAVGRRLLARSMPSTTSPARSSTADALRPARPQCWRTSASRTRSRYRGGRRGRTSRPCAASGRETSVTRGRPAPGMPRPRSAGPRLDRRPRRKRPPARAGPSRRR